MGRTRERSGQLSSTQAVRLLHYCNGQTANVGNLSIGNTPFHEVITDDECSRRLFYPGGSRLMMKSVFHQKWTSQVSSEGPWFSATYNTCGPGHEWWTFMDSINPSAGALAYMFAGSTDCSTLMQGWIPPPASHDEAAHYARWLRKKPTMATRANMAVFLAELREIKRMFEILPGKHFSLSPYSTPVKDWKELLRYANGQHLNWNFGWKPFLRDLREAWKGLDTFDERLKHFLRKQDMLISSHAVDRSGASDVVQNWHASANSQFMYRVRRTHLVTSRSTFEYTYTLPPYDFDGMRWRAWLDTLGIAATPANVWAIIPWSFVCDWFVGVGPYLQQFSRDWIEPTIIFLQACSSQKITGTLSMDAKWTLAGKESFCDDLLTLYYTSYARTPGIPAYCYQEPAPLSADKIRLLASLGFARL